METIGAIAVRAIKVMTYIYLLNKSCVAVDTSKLKKWGLTAAAAAAMFATRGSPLLPQAVWWLAIAFIFIKFCSKREMVWNLSASVFLYCCMQIVLIAGAAASAVVVLIFGEPQNVWSEFFLETIPNIISTIIFFMIFRQRAAKYIQNVKRRNQRGIFLFSLVIIIPGYAASVIGPDPDFSIGIPLAMMVLFGAFIFAYWVYDKSYEQKKIEELTAFVIKTRAENEIENNAADKAEQISKKVAAVLAGFNLSYRLKGQIYIREALVLALFDSKATTNMSHNIYAHIAAENKSNVKAVDKCIREAIEDIWCNNDAEKLKALYPFDWSAEAGRPTNAEFIKNMAGLISAKDGEY